MVVIFPSAAILARKFGLDTISRQPLELDPHPYCTSNVRAFRLGSTDTLLRTRLQYLESLSHLLEQTLVALTFYQIVQLVCVIPQIEQLLDIVVGPQHVLVVFPH